MGREGLLERVRGFARRDKRDAVPAEPDVRSAERSRNHRLNLALHDLSKKRLDGMGLHQEAREEIGTAIRTAFAIQREEDEILWKAAMQNSNLSPEMINKISNIEADLEFADKTAYNGEPLPPGE
jgi:hypothetical protein